ncbi:MAG TPA: NAD(P)-dependent alcohol dehydrogenase [Microthrixaceae bacterium]|nr:NAD(P)-dependent alcohol dehydrogenase [Microthrixaceae bacterium]
MRAVLHERYGPPEVLHLGEVEPPKPKADEVRVVVHAATVNRTDCGFRSGKPFIVRFFSGLLRPRRKILGTEFAGVIDAVGGDVTEFAVGDEVFGVHEGFGAHAEYVCVGEGTPIAAKPTNVGFIDAAAVSDGVILALTCLRAPEVGAGTNLLVYGASGSIGSAAVQLAKNLGAEVTAVCNTVNVDVVAGLGAHEVIDYTRHDFTRNGRTYDVVFDAVGKLSYRRTRRSVRPGGFWVTTDGGYFWQNPLLVVLTRFFGSRRALMPLPKYRKAEVLLVKELIEAGEYHAVVDRCYPLEEVVDATRYVETQQKTGNVVLTVVAPS